MSGPKLSAAEIERLRQEQLEKARQEALRKLLEAQKAYRVACKKTEDLNRDILSFVSQVDDGYKLDMEKEIGTLLSILLIKKINDEKSAEEYLAVAKEMEDRQNQVKQLLEPIVKRYIDRSNSDKNLSQANRIHQTFQYYVDKKEDPIDVKNIDFTYDYDIHQLIRKIRLIQTHYQWMALHGDSSAQKRFASTSIDSIQKILNDDIDLKKTKSIVQCILNNEAELIRRENEVNNLYDSYVAIATLVNVVPKKITDFTDIQALQEAISEYNEILRKKDEMDFIADQINDAMVSLGYGLVTSRTMMRQDQSEMDCSLYQADDRTGIAIYTDQTGAVMMRMTVLGTDVDITEDDEDFSYQRQIDFCAGHQDIVAALAERGVYIKQKNYKAPHKKYTYKVNMNSMKSATQKDKNGQIVLNRVKVDRRQRRRANKKKMRAM